MLVRAKYVTEFTIRKGKVAASRVLFEENATTDQAVAIKLAKPLVAKFVRSRLSDEITHEECKVNVKVSYIETAKGLEISFRI
jgi:hypothetical protein